MLTAKMRSEIVFFELLLSPSQAVRPIVLSVHLQECRYVTPARLTSRSLLGQFGHEKSNLYFPLYQISIVFGTNLRMV